MIVYRITTEQWSKSITASGNAARWNPRGRFIIYTAESRSLACLENLVHRSGEGNSQLFKVMLIEVPDKITVAEIESGKLKKGWQETGKYSFCQSIGAQWLDESSTCILKVPSVIIKNEFNYLLNPSHPDFKKIKLLGEEAFDFDKRF